MTRISLCLRTVIFAFAVISPCSFAAEVKVEDDCCGENQPVVSATDWTPERPPKPETVVLTPTSVTINRVVPVNEAPLSVLDLLADPTDQHLRLVNVDEEPLVPTGATTTQHNQQVAAAIRAMLQAPKPDEGVASLVRYLDQHADSPWRLSLLVNMGLRARRAGAFTLAQQYWQQVMQEWSGRLPDSADSRAQLGRCYAELGQFYVRFGQVEKLRALLRDFDASGLSLSGASVDGIARARVLLRSMTDKPEVLFRCGPYAIDGFCRLMKTPGNFNKVTRYYNASSQGTSLLQMQELGTEVGLPLMAVQRQPGSDIIAPAVMHWKLGHFSLVVESNKDSVLIRDVTEESFQSRESWMSRAVFEQEASGYFLIAKTDQALPAGWSVVGPDVAQTLLGKHCSECVDSDPDECGPCSKQTGGCHQGPGMPTYSLQLSRVSFRLTDTPIFYQPAQGPGVSFTLSYEHRGSRQPAVFNFGNVGSKWSHNFMSYAVASDANAQQKGGPYAIELAMPNGGVERYSFTAWDPNWSVVGGAHPNVPATWAATSPYYKSGAILRLVNGLAFERVASDGSRMVYGRLDTNFVSDGSVTMSRYFLTKIVDPLGHALSLSYDNQNRLTGITDALGQVTTLAYGGMEKPLHITGVTDPFGRAISLTYTGDNLSSIKDVVNLTSSFSYLPGTDDVVSMTTPYGTTTFDFTEKIGIDFDRSVVVTDPLGDKEKIEYRNSDAAQVGSYPADPVGTVPTGINAGVSPAGFNNATLYWDRLAMRQYPEDRLKAVCYTWALLNNSVRSALMESVKYPLQNRVWFGYPGQTGNATTKFYVSGLALPIKVARVVDGGATQMTEYAYDASGRTTMEKDPLGRTTKMTYTGSVLTKVTQSLNNGTEYVLMEATPHATFSSLPGTVTEASGQRFQFFYNAAGQISSVTLPQRAGQPVETVQMGYTGSYLTSVTDLSGVTNIGYDGLGRVRTVTTVNDGYSTTTDYDALNRPTKVTFPDGTFEQTNWTRLDPEWTRDREGRWTHSIYDARQQVVAIQDPNGGTTTLGWCKCGSLGNLIDPMGRQTIWSHDLQGRLLAKIHANGDRTTYAYQPASGRLASITDSKLQVQNLTYNIDNSLASMSYSNAAVATAGISYTYDPTFSRVASMTDGTGTTNYAYYPYPTVIPTTPTTGTGQLSSIDGPLVNDTITFTYDEWKRGTTTDIAGSARSQSYDAVGRVGALINALGTFTPTYIGTTSRPSSVAMPGGLQAIYTWAAVNQDLRMTGMKYQRADASRISEQTYTYAGDGRIATWTQQADNATASTWSYGYDRIDQLLSATKRQAGTFIQSQGWSYDKAGNRTSTQALTSTSGSVWSSTFNTANQMQTAGPGGKLRVIGHLDEAGTVKINGADTPVEADKTFSQLIDVVPGSATFSVQAKDLKGNTRTTSYQVSSTAGAANRSLLYDNNGNCTNDGAALYTWDAANCLVDIVNGTAHTVMTYNGFGQRVRIQEFTGATLISDRRFVWLGNQIVEERDSANAVVKRFFPQGVQIVTGTPVSYLYTKDHLGSIREVVTTAGVVQARYEYDAWGNRTKVSGTFDADFGYTGHYHHAPSGLVLTWFRAYDPTTGRWLSREPLGEAANSNLYAYGPNSPVIGFDPDGRLFWFAVPLIIWATEFLVADAAIGYAITTTVAATAVAVTVSAASGNSPGQVAEDGLNTAALTLVMHGPALANARPCPGGPGGPKISPNVKPNSNPPQLPYYNLPKDTSIRSMPPTKQYPNGYWKMEKDLNKGRQALDPRTCKPPNGKSTTDDVHVPYPPGFDFPDFPWRRY